MKRKSKTITQASMILTMVVTILFACVLLFIYIDSRGKPQYLSPDMGRYLPKDVSEALTIESCYVSNVVNDSAEFFLFNISKYLDGRIKRHLLETQGWKELPMTEEEYEIYVKGCCGWPASHFGNLMAFNLTDKKCEGLWFYSGDYDSNLREPACYLGDQQVLLYVEGEEYNRFIYMFQHE